MIPSELQLAIYEEGKHGNSDIVVMATAGSGKSTTIVEFSKQINTRALLLAFNKHIVQSIIPRVPRNINVKTIHAVGYGCVRDFIRGLNSPNDRKYLDISRSFANEIIQNANDYNLSPFKIAKQINDVSRFCRLTLTNPKDHNAVRAMVGKFSLEVADQELILPVIEKVIAEGDYLAKARGTIDFTDMLWLPHSFNLEPPAYPFVMVDEAQDLNEAQLELVMKSSRGRRLFVGDKYQAIMAFAGANCDSMDRIVEKTNAKVLPLSICYRCPTSHIKLAKVFSPDIQPAPNAIEGEVIYLNEKDIAEHLQAKDLVICRMTAPLIKLCLELVAKNIQAIVRGEDLANQLIDLVKEVEKMPGFDFRKFMDFLDDYARDKAIKLAGVETNQLVVTTFLDKVDGVRYCYNFFNPRNIDWFCQDIERLFSEKNAEHSVILSTIHRAKGLENDRIFILYPEKLPLKWKNQKESELEQEYNICFVAYTRSKKSLFLVRENKKSLAEMDGDTDDEEYFYGGEKAFGYF